MRFFCCQVYYTPFKSLHAGYFFMFLFVIYFFAILFQDNYQRVKRFESRSEPDHNQCSVGPDLCQTVCNGSHLTTKIATCKEIVKVQMSHTYTCTWIVSMMTFTYPIQNAAVVFDRKNSGILSNP